MIVVSLDSRLLLAARHEDGAPRRVLEPLQRRIVKRRGARPEDLHALG